jgi:hypothetical protein
LIYIYITQQFRENQDLTDTEEINKALEHGQYEYEVLRRQAIISQLYDPEENYIIDEVRNK